MIDKEKLLGALEYYYKDEFEPNKEGFKALDWVEKDIKNGLFDMEKPKETCKWTEQEDCNDEIYYDTQCGSSFAMVDGSKISEIDADFKYCPYCGKAIEEITNVTRK